MDTLDKLPTASPTAFDRCLTHRPQCQGGHETLLADDLVVVAGVSSSWVRPVRSSRCETGSRHRAARCCATPRQRRLSGYRSGDPEVQKPGARQSAQIAKV